jgi:hypothetical protein
MFDWLSKGENDAIAMLKRDHDTVKDLFDQFENSDSRPERHKIAMKALLELEVHTILESEIFYPAIRPQLDHDVMNEADEEHHVARVLMDELEKMKGNEEHYDAKFKVLAESVRHHIKEEESEMLPKARDLSIDFDALGARMMERKQELLTREAPAPAKKRSATAKKRTAKPRAHSPARTSASKKRTPKTRTA